MILLVIDMQKGLVDEELYDYDNFVDRTTQLIEAARKNNVEVIFVQHDAGSDSGMTVGDEAFEIADQVRPKPGEKVFVKTINSCFGNKELADYLASTGEKELMIIGLQTNFCIDASIKSAFERGYKVIVPEGTNSTFDNDYMTGETTYNYYNEFIWPNRFADIVDFEEAMNMI